MDFNDRDHDHENKALVKFLNSSACVLFVSFFRTSRDIERAFRAAWWVPSKRESQLCRVLFRNQRMQMGGLEIVQVSLNSPATI